MKQVFLIISVVLMGIHSISAQCYPERHTTNGFDGWVSCDKAVHPEHPNRGETHWIEYDFGSSHSLHDIVFWNMNHPEYADDGFKDVIIEHSSNGNTWITADTVTIPRAPVSGFYEGHMSIDLGGVTARYLLLTGLTNYGGFCYGLSEIKVYTTDVTPTEFNLDITTCEKDGILTNLTGGMEMNGLYSGIAVTDNGDGTFNFNADEAGPGLHEVTYLYNGGSLSANIKVLPCSSPACANCPDCGDFDESVLSSNPIPQNTYHMSALHGSGTVGVNLPVNFRGNTEVVMEPGFEVSLNSNFSAEIRDCDENLLSNPAFEWTDQDWEIYVYTHNNTSAASMTYNSSEFFEGDQALEIDITHTSGDAWTVQLYQEGLTIEAGKTYEFSFYGKKVNGGDVILHIFEDGGPGFIWHRFDDITSEWGLYSISFEANETVNNNVEFGMRLGENAGTYYFDGFKLLEENE